MNRQAVLTAIAVLATTMFLSLPSTDAAITTAPAPTPITLFSDDFSGDLSKWSIVTGDWSIRSGELLGHGWGADVDAWIYAGDPSWSDYALQGEVAFVDCNAELVLRSTGHWQNEYRVSLWQDTPGCAYRNSYNVMKYRNGVVTLFNRGLPGAVDSNVPSPVPITNPLTARVEVVGNTIAVYVNNQFVNRFTDPDPLPSGRIGLGVIWNLSTRYDDVTVTSLAVATPTPTPTPTATPAAVPTPTPTPTAIDAKVEIVFPHDAAGNAQPVTGAPLANIGVDLFSPGTLAPVACNFPNTVRLFRSINNQPAQSIAVGERQVLTMDGTTFPQWVFNNVDVSPAIDPNNKVFFFVQIDGISTNSNTWSHAADPRTFFPQQDVPSGVGPAGASLDAKIEIVFPHDVLGNPRPVTEATLVNLGIDLFNSGTLQSVSADFNSPVRLIRSLNTNVAAPLPGVGQRMIVTTGGVSHPRWVFNNVDVTQATQPPNNYSFRAVVDGMTSFPNVWVHGAESRTIFPLMDVPSQSGGNCS